VRKTFVRDSVSLARVRTESANEMSYLWKDGLEMELSKGRCAKTSTALVSVALSSKKVRNGSASYRHPLSNNSTHNTNMLCAISGEAPREPVASRKSGNVFEKRLIEAHIAENHTDPVTGEDLAVEDLIELKSPQVVTPRAPNLTSIPALLSAFQNEWDAIVLETHTLKQQLAQTRQELSTALYQNDAATRVITRVSRERDEAREALSNVTISGGGASNGDAMQVDGQALPEELIAKVDETQAQYVFIHSTGFPNTNRLQAIRDSSKAPSARWLGHGRGALHVRHGIYERTRLPRQQRSCPRRVRRLGTFWRTGRCGWSLLHVAAKAGADSGGRKRGHSDSMVGTARRCGNCCRPHQDLREWQ